MADQDHRPPSPSPSDASMNSNRSMMEPPKLNGEPDDIDEREQTPRPVSPSPSGVSMKSSRSMMEPPKLSGESEDIYERWQTPRPVSPSPSGVSMKSSRSMMEPPKLSGEPADIDEREQTPRSVSPSPSGVSMKSSRSMMEPPKLSGEPDDIDEREQTPRPVSPSPSGVSMKSSRSMMEPPKLSGESQDIDERKCFLPDTVPRTSHRSCNDNYRTIFTQHKDYLKKQVENIRERVLNPDSQKPHGSIDTTLYITEGEYKAVDVEHGVAQVEVRGSEDTQINYNGIFNPLPGQNGPIRAVLTKGAPCIGKTVLVQRFISDWADGKANQDIDVVILLPLRLLNRIKREISLQQLLSQLYPSLQEWVNSVKLEDYQILFIFFALDECNLPLNFEQNRKLSDISQKASVDTLVTSLIMGSLVPNARIWITSRHVASDQIPPEVIDKVTEVRGFTDVQKEEYFKRHISDEGLAERIISHIKASRSIQAMCRLPVFCWIAATVLQQMEFSDEIPTTLTEMFIHFLLIQTTSRHKYQGDNNSAKQDTLEAQKHTILKLAELAFKQLNEGNLMFSDNDLKQCGLDITEALVYSGLCTATLKGQAAIFGEMYTFVHITIQEFLAALYIFVSYVKEDTEALRPLLMKKSSMPKIPSKHPSLEELLRYAVNSALESKSGHLDLFVRFLHGMAMESNQKVLRVLLACQQDNPRCISNPESLKRAAQNLKDIKRKDISPDQWINLLYCLVEIHDTTVHQEVQAFMHSETGALKRLKPAHCSALASTLMMAAMPMEEFDLKKYKTSDEGRRRLVPAVRSCKKALLADCKLTAKSCEIVESALKAPRSLLQVLDMSHNNLQDSGVKHLSSGLRSSNCVLETLRLSACGITGKGCELLASALTANPAHLKELDLSSNHLKEAQLRTLQSIKENPESALEILKWKILPEPRGDR